MTSNGGMLSPPAMAIPEQTSQLVPGNEAETKLVEICKDILSMDDNHLQGALSLFRRTAMLMTDTGVLLGTADEVRRFCQAASIYVTKKLDRREFPGFTLTQVLEATNVGAIEFFKELPQFAMKCGSLIATLYGPDWESRLEAKEDKADFIHLIGLFRYYKRIYCECFEYTGTENKVPDQMRLGWVLFVSMRLQVLGRFPDMATCSHALLAVIAVMIVHMPTSLRKLDGEFLCKRDDTGAYVVASLSQREQASQEDVKSMVMNVQSILGSIFGSLLTKKSSNDIPQLYGLNTEAEGILYFEGLMGESMLKDNLQALERCYEEHYRRQGGLDERICIYAEEGCENLSLSSLSSSLNTKSLLSQVISSQPGSPPLASPTKPATENKMLPPTPVSTTMTTAKWLRTVIAVLHAEPPPKLLEFFKACNRDVTDEMLYRTKVVVEAIFSSSRGTWKVSNSGGMDNTWIEQRKLETVKLYYRVLCVICTAEANRLHNNNLTTLLENDKFHRCLIACSAELVLTSHKTVIMTFPAVLEPAGINAFDLSKVMETFVRYEDILPRELKRHLHSIEERIIESMAWEKGSSMYNSLIVAKPELRSEILRQNLLCEPMPSLDSLAPGPVQQTADAPASPEREAAVQTQPASFVSPARHSAFTAVSNNNRCNLSQNLQSSFASPQRPNPTRKGETCAEYAIKVFFEKVLKLSGCRIDRLCERLGQPGQVRKYSYGLVEHALKETTRIFFCRHIDQIILCAVYGVAKVIKLQDLTFRDIIYHYRKQPQCKSYIFRSVLLDLRRSGKPGQETGDIIKFYNEYFVPTFKSFLIGIQQEMTAASDNNNAGGGAAAPASPRPSPPPTFPSVPDMSPKKVSSKHNVYVSPLRSTKVENIMSPHSLRLYACVGESTHAYQSPSKDLTAINNRLNNRRFGKLDFDVSMVSDSFVAGDFCPKVPANLACNSEQNEQSDTMNEDNNNGSNGSEQNLKRAAASAPQSPSPKRPKLDR